MPKPTNLTEGLAHLRGKNRVMRPLENAVEPKPALEKPVMLRARERRLATDPFSLFVYTLLAVAILSQVALMFGLG